VRHRTPFQNTGTPQANSSVVHVHNAVQFREEPRDHHTRNKSSRVVVPVHLEPEMDREDWARKALKLLSDKALKKVSPINRFLDHPNGFIELKEKLLSGQLEQKRSSSLEDLFTSRQRKNESLSQFAHSLKDLAGETLMRNYEKLRSQVNKQKL